jgi:hypothetical protein
MRLCTTGHALWKTRPKLAHGVVKINESARPSAHFSFLWIFFNEEFIFPSLSFNCDPTNLTFDVASVPGGALCLRIVFRKRIEGT